VDFLALGPVVVGVALEAAGFGVIGSGSVAGFAVGDAGNEKVGGLRAGEGFLVAVDAAEPAVGVVIKFGVREPLQGGIGRSDFRQRVAGVEQELMTLLAGLSPQQVFGVGGALSNPLGRSENADYGPERLAG